MQEERWRAILGVRVLLFLRENERERGVDFLILVVGGGVG
jgi:hypothetical protein